MKKRLTADIEKRLRKFLRYAQEVHRTHDEEAIHKMRVMYKKLRALLRLAHGSNKAHIPKQMKALYAAAGVIRDLQLHRETVHTYFAHSDEMPYTYLCHVTKAITKSASRFDKVYEHISGSKLSNSVLDSIPKHLMPKEMREWHEHITQAATILTNDNTTADQDVHQLRKYNKDLVYVADYLPAPRNSKEITETTGSFMDSSVLLEMLAERDHGIPRKELEMLEGLQKDQSRQKEYKLKEVKQALHSVAT